MNNTKIQEHIIENVFWFQNVRLKFLVSEKIQCYLNLISNQIKSKKGVAGPKNHFFKKMKKSSRTANVRIPKNQISQKKFRTDVQT